MVCFFYVAHLQGLQAIPPYHRTQDFSFDQAPAIASDFAEVRGQELAKRELEIASAAQHNMLMVGPPGTAKTLLARSLSSILPGLILEEALEVTRMYSVSNVLPADAPLVRQRPFRASLHDFSRRTRGRRAREAPTVGGLARLSESLPLTGGCPSARGRASSKGRGSCHLNPGFYPGASCTAESGSRNDIRATTLSKDPAMASWIWAHG